MTIADQLIALLDADSYKRQQAFAKRRKIYDGELSEPLTGPTAPLDNILIPAPKSIVDDGVSYLFGEEPTFDVTEAYGEDAQRFLTRVWRENVMATKLIEWAKFGGTAGTGVLKFEPDADDVTNGDHEIIVTDPAYLDVVWDPHNVRRVLLYRFEYPTSEQVGNTTKVFVFRQDIAAVQSAPNEYGRTKTIAWEITNWKAEAPTHGNDITGKWIGFTATRQISKWELVSGPHHWEHTWAPVFVNQNLIAPGEYWGYSDIEDAIIRLTDALNRVASNTAKTIRHFAHPKTVFIGASAPTNAEIGQPIELPGDPGENDVKNLEMQSDLTAALDFLRELQAILYEHAKRPDVARGKIDKLGNLSGTAIKLLFGNMSAQNDEKRKTYGDVLRSLLRNILEYGGFTPLSGKDADIDIVWGDPLPRNEKEDAEVAEIDQRLGASKRTTLKQRGYDPDVEFDNGNDEGSVDPSVKGMRDLLDGGLDPIGPTDSTNEARTNPDSVASTTDE